MGYKLVRIVTVPISLEKLLGGQLHFMKQYYDVIAVSSDRERLEKAGKQEEVRTYMVKLTRKITPLADIKALFKLYNFLRNERPFIVHTHTPKAGTIGMIAAWLTNVPNRLHTVAGLPLLETVGIKRKLLNFVERITYACANHVYPNSFGLMEIIVKERLCEAGKLKVLASGSSNGINTQYFSRSHFSIDQNKELRKKLNIKYNEFVFIFVGRIVSDKGINDLVEAFCNLYEENNNIKLLLVGPKEEELDSLRPSTEEIIEDHAGVITTGYRDDVRPYFSISNALVFPSYREGFPNVVMQAGAMGLPAIVSDINGCNEIIIEGKNGMIVPPKNRQALINSMRILIDDTRYYDELRENARRMITERYEQDVVWRALLSEYKALENDV